MGTSELIRELEYRRDAWRALAEAVNREFPKFAKALREKVDRDLVALLKEGK